MDKMLERFPNIHYYEGRDSFCNYKASNEVIGIIGSFSGDSIEPNSAEEAAVVLWERFIQSLGR
jgi:hypothetical protein